MVARRGASRGWASALLLSAVLAFLGGCEFLPGSEAYEIERAKRTATSSLIDPSSAQFRDVQKHGGWVCGELNAKNRMGAFVGFQRFIVQLDINQAQLDPQFRYTDLIEAQDLCRSLTNNSYSSVSTTVSACDRASEQQASQSLQSIFDLAWTKHCSPVRAKPLFRPALNDSITGPPSEEEAPVANQADADLNMSIAAPDSERVMNVNSPVVDEEGNAVNNDYADD